MKISKIYANDPRFKPITFNDGFNVIYGDVEVKINHTTGRAHEHNLGKTSLVGLIDFLLLKGVSRDSIFGRHKDKFSTWVFFIELKLNNGRYLTVRRSIDHNTKISFKEHFSKHQDFSKLNDWDRTDLALNAKIKEDNPKAVLDAYLGFNVAPEYNYRTYLGYLLRAQDDYGDVFKLKKFDGKDIDWKPALFKLLGFAPDSVEKKYTLDNEKSDETKLLERIRANTESDEVYKIRAAIEAKESERDQLQEKISAFDFYQKEQDINIDLVKNIETEISVLNQREYALSYQQEQIQQSLDASQVASINMDDVKKLFEEVEVLLPAQLVKDYKDVETFTFQLTTERNKYLKDELDDIQAKIGVVRKQLQKLNHKRSQALLVLGEKDTFAKFKRYQAELTKAESDIVRYQTQLENAETIEKYQKNLDTLGQSIKNVSEKIKQQVSDGNKDFQNIKALFHKLFKFVLGYTALLVVEPNKKGNVNFETTVLDSADGLTGMDEGHTFKKTLCACFVLSILANYSDRSFFRFAYHDGVMDGLGNNPKGNFIEMARDIAATYDVQYIISVIKSDIPSTISLTEDEVRRRLTDSDTLFGIKF